MFLSLCGALALSASGRAAELLPTGTSGQDYFGTSVSISGTTGLVGAYYDGRSGVANAGAAYLYEGVTTLTGTNTQTARLTEATPTATDFFGYAVSLSGNLGLVGTIYPSSQKGAAYVFRNLAGAGANQTPTLTLTLAGAAINARFGSAVSLDGTSAVIGASGNATGGNAAYLYRGLDTATGNPNSTAKLVASGAAATDGVGTSVSLSNSMAVVGVSSGTWVYLYRGLNTATGDVNQAAKLTATGISTNSGFGRSVSLDGASALVGAGLSNAVYLYRDLDTNSNTTITQTAKLVAANPGLTPNFGVAVAISGKNGLVGASQDKNGTFNNAGGAFLYTNLDTATGSSVTETVKVTASDAAANNYFGISVAIDGDYFIIGARGATNVAGKAYTGSVSSMTTLDAGAASRDISGLNFSSRTDWIVGENTGSNSVALSAGSSAGILSGKHIFIGRNGGADGNTLDIAGSVTADDIYVGSILGNQDNALTLEQNATLTVGSIYLAKDNVISLEGDYATAADILGYFSTRNINLYVYGSNWTMVDQSSYPGLITFNTADGYTTITAIPEPSTLALAGLGLLAGLFFARRRTVRFA